ncbi:SpoVR family protein [Haloparvum sp. PAK95]|uniref:SpoVR family protein n=1 Tax=Haloparvum sp. PAK95 TaxID=3418962 RepID=UPI003D2F0692
MTRNKRRERKRIARELEPVVSDARLLAAKLGLDGHPVNYWIVDYDEMNQLIAYDGFPERYPHWRWGMKYERQRKQDRYGAGKAFEIVINDDPAHAYLQESNSLADQKAVITHVEAHADFFKNNRWFRPLGESVNAVDMLERHADRIESYMRDPEIDREAVERFIDSVLTLTNTIDQHQPVDQVLGDEGAPEDLDEPFEALDLSEEVREEVFGESAAADGDDAADEADGDSESAAGDSESAAATAATDGARDVLAYLREHGKQYDADAERAVEMADWQTDVLEMLRREAYYFAPQQMTKVMNEGWACVAPDTPIFTSDGLIPMKEVVDREVAVSDGVSEQPVYDSNIIPDHDTVTIRTRRGFELSGSVTHRVRRPDDSWIRLDKLDEGSEIEISGGNGVWSSEYVPIEWESPSHVTLHDVADDAGVSIWTVMRYRDTGRARQADAIEEALTSYEGENQRAAQLAAITVPDKVTEAFGRFLGLLLGDGHIATDSRHVGFTSDTEAHAEEFADLVRKLFDVDPTVEKQGRRWRVYAYSENLKDILMEEFDLPEGKAAGRKSVPEAILRSPRSVVAEFLCGLFDADGYAGDQGVILSTKSEDMSRVVQLLLTNFGILSRRREQSDGCYHVHMTGWSANKFAEQITFGYSEKQERLRSYVDDLAWFEEESWTDEVVEVETGTGTVYDISVTETHRYAGAGFINHNSHWESVMMGEEAFADADEFLTYAEHQARVLGSEGFNPYKLGTELWEHVENVTNRREVVEQLLRVDGVSAHTFHDEVDVDAVLDELEPTPPLDAISADSLDRLAELDPAKVDHEALDRARSGELDVREQPWRVLTYKGLAERHFSLTKPRNRGFLGRIDHAELERIDRYLFDDAVYDSVADALADVDYTAGWDRLYEVRESHNDVTFLDEFLTPEFVRANDYFTYEYSHAAGEYRVSGTDPDSVKRKLLLQFTNFGKPTVVVADGNYENRNELLLHHEYNGVQLDVSQATETLKRVFELWGRPVNLKTIVKTTDEADDRGRLGDEPNRSEEGKLLRYDGDAVEMADLAWHEVEDVVAEGVDYDTKPDEWL